MADRPLVLLVEPIHPDFRKLLESKAEVLEAQAFTEDYFVQTVSSQPVAGIIIRTKGALTRRVLDAAKHLKVIGRHGIGMDHIDVRYAYKKKIAVVNTPAGSLDAVAEHTWMMILGLAKHALSGDQAVRGQGPHSFNGFRTACPSLELRGKRLGILGLGRIGTRVAEIGKRGFGMDIAYTDIREYPAKARKLHAQKLPLAKLLQSCAVVSIHVPLTRKTRGMINAKALARLKPGAGPFLINCARGPVLDAEAVRQALVHERLAGLGVDVFDPEVPDAEHPLRNAPRTVLSPHNAAQTEEARYRYAEVVKDVLGVLAGKPPQNPIDLKDVE